MKTSTDYRKRKHMIVQDEDGQTEEIELRKLRKSLVKVFKQIWTSTQQQKWGNERVEEIEQVSSVKTMIWQTSSNCCLSYTSGWSGWVFKLEDTQSRTHSPHRIILELRSHRPHPTLVVSLHSWLPNLHRLDHSAIHKSSWMLRPWRLTVLRIHSPQR